MNLLASLIAILILILIALAGTTIASLKPVFFVVIPCSAFAVFVAGFVYRILSWGRLPVPFSIPTTCGQEKSLPWIKCDYLESPPCTATVIGRMALEVLLFRSLFRNTRLYLYVTGPSIRVPSGSGSSRSSFTGPCSLSSCDTCVSSSSPLPRSSMTLQP